MNAPLDLPGPMRAAVVLLLLDEAAAAELLAGLDPIELEAIAAAMPAAADLDAGVVAAVADAFVGTHRATLDRGTAEPGQVTRALDRVLSAPQAATLRARTAAEAARDRLPSLAWFDPPGLALALQPEHAQAAAVVLAAADPRLAAATLRELEEPRRIDVVRRIATLGPLRAEALDDIEAMLAARLALAAARRPVTTGGAQAAARIVAGLGRSAAEALVRDLGTADPDLAGELDAQLLTVEQLTELPGRMIAAILAAVDEATLVTALRGLDPDGRRRLLAGLSQRAAQTLLDEAEAMGAARVVDVQAAQRDIVRAARRLAAEGVIDLGGEP